MAEEKITKDSLNGQEDASETKRRGPERLLSGAERMFYGYA
jgi:hypothetical protein